MSGRRSDGTELQEVPAGCSRLTAALADVTRSHPTSRKLLVAPDVNYGRELLATLARLTGGWIGWEAATLRGIADALAFVPVSRLGLRVVRDVEIDALVDRALHAALRTGAVSVRVEGLARSLGFRRTLRDAVLELRAAGVSPDDLGREADPSGPVHDVRAVLAEYERLLDAEALADPARMFRVALEHFGDEAPFVLNAEVLLAPSLLTRGLPGALLQRLLDAGARVLDADEPFGIAAPARSLASTDASRSAPGPAPASPLAWVAAGSPPDPSDASLDPTLAASELFAAATPTDEVREVLRRVVAEGLRWDDVEVVATNPDAYGIALDALCERLGIGLTMLKGIPLARTRLGRALERWLVWLDEGLPADSLRQALEAGELRVTGSPAAPTALARELRLLRVGWGRARYEAALERLEDGRRLAEIRRRDDESEEELAARRAARAPVLDALAHLLRALLAAAPPVPEGDGDRGVRASCAGLARATLAWLELVAVHGPAEAQAMERLRQRLALLAAVQDEETDFAAALAALREALAELRAWPLVTSDRKPWSSTGGMLHLTDVAHAGVTGRRRVFIVGLDADRTAGPTHQDPLLPDAVRSVLPSRPLPTSVERREEWSYALASALASLRGRVTLSYATSASLDEREAGPSPLLLQAWRIARNDPSLSYESLRDALRPPACAVPAPAPRERGEGVAPIDARDVWLGAIADGAVLLDATAAVRAAFPSLDAGLAARAEAGGTRVTAHHGLVPAAGAVLDPTERPRPISPSSLEKLAACPLSWFYQYGLALVPPVDPAYDADRWLDARDRGSLLHEVFERFARDYMDRQDALAGPAAQERILAIVNDAIDRWRELVPPPGEVVFAQEAEDLRRAALAFLEMEREARTHDVPGRWRELEMEFGFESPPARYDLPNGRSLAVRGRVDRVDELADGTLRVVDYKTGAASPYRRSPRQGEFNGGRRLQPALYAAAVQQATDHDVSVFEYRFPTTRGENACVAYRAEELDPARGLVSDLIAEVRSGAFIPTTDSHDCAYCDHGPICRVVRGDFGGAASPRADWAKTNGPGLPIYAPMLARRGQGGAQDAGGQERDE